MKKTFGIIMSIFFLFSLSSCSCAKNNEEQTVEQGYYLINDYETTNDFGLVRTFGVLGKIEKNTQPEYVTSGSASAKITVVSNPFKEAVPYLEQELELLEKGEDYRDFSNVAAVAFDVYNASEAEVKIGIQLTYEEGNGMKEYHNIPKGWSTVKLDIDREYIPLTTSTDDITAPWVENMRVTFERGETDRVFYFDNFRLYKARKDFQPVVMSLKTNEICSFDSEWQAMMLEPSVEHKRLLPSFIWEKEITSDGIGSSLRVETGISKTPDGTTYPGFELNKEMTKLIPWADYPDDAKLCFDVYAPEVNGVDTVWISAYTENDRYYVSGEIEVQAGKWTTFSVSVKDMNGQLNSDRYNFAKTTSVVLRWKEYFGTPRIVYFDNIRMELPE